MSEIKTELKTPEKKSRHGIFDDFLDNNVIFENKEVLRPNYTPDNLPHRDKQSSHLPVYLFRLSGEIHLQIFLFMEKQVQVRQQL